MNLGNIMLNEKPITEDNSAQLYLYGMSRTEQRQRGDGGDPGLGVEERGMSAN